MAQKVKHLPAVRETQVRSRGWEDLLEKEMATHSSILAFLSPVFQWVGESQTISFGKNILSSNLKHVDAMGESESGSEFLAEALMCFRSGDQTGLGP